MKGEGTKANPLLGLRLLFMPRFRLTNSVGPGHGIKAEGGYHQAFEKNGLT